jgi:hypothetical protein
MLQIIGADPAIAMAFCDSRSIDGEGAPVYPSYKAYFATVEAGALARTEIFDGREFVRRFLSVKNTILNVSAVVWRREALLRCLEACRGELSAFHMAGDWRLYIECLSAPGAKIAYVADPLNVHRRHARSVTHALDADRHLDEIDRMHRIARRRLGDVASLAKRQDAYLEEVRRQFAALAPPAPAPSRRRTRSRRSREFA